MIDKFYIIAFICKKSTFSHRNNRMGICKDIQINRYVMSISGYSGLEKRNPGNTVYKYIISLN